MRYLLPTTTTVATVVLLLLLLALPATTVSAQSGGAVVYLDPPDDVDYWVCDDSDTRLHWGAVGIVIDDWDTRASGFNHDSLIWYHFRYVYPDGRTYQQGYNYTPRNRPDPCIRVGTWAIHNWPCCSESALIPLHLTAVRRRNPAPPPPPRPVLVTTPPPTWNPPMTTVSVNTRWYPPPPTISYTTSVSYGSRYGFYAGSSFNYNMNYCPYQASRYATTRVIFVNNSIGWGSCWSGYNNATAINYMQAQALGSQYQETLRQPGPPMVDYIGELAARLQGVERYTGSAIEKQPTGVLTNADRVFASLASRHLPDPEDESRRVPARLYSRMPMPDLEAVGKEKSPGEFTASLVQDMRPLVREGAASAVESVALLDQTLGLWSGRDPAIRPRGQMSGAAPRLVSATLLEPDEAANEAEVSVIERATAAFDELTSFVEADDNGDIGSATLTPVDSRPVFSLASNTTTIDSAAGQRDYERNPEPVNINALVAEDDEAPMQTIKTDSLQRTVNFHRIEWRPLEERYREITGEASASPLLAPPALRSDAATVWEKFFMARSR